MGAANWTGTPATIDVLPEIVAAVGDKMEVYMDSGGAHGRRRGQGARSGSSGGLRGATGALGTRLRRKPL
ncbi:hypothetical protein MTO96_050770 [Rhipicephalus appendiculatus]